ncbi:MAG: alpha/beta hydrolase [Prevotellaceae bacterium]|jgi:pimeloyl-ACP methyl ester carboxylesterase|nr:alpha/beta hydrolase [Prevotellaceae bacterium]
MKRFTVIIIVALASLNAWGQDISGAWNGILNLPSAVNGKIQSIQLRVVFHIQKTATGYTATMDSPDQGAKDIPVTSVSFENKVLKLSIANAGIEYEGVLNADGNITGTFRQMQISLEVNLTREKLETEKPRRPQEPSKPYPYYEEEVSFENRDDGVTLAGTLTLPEKEGRFPAVVLISGSGAQNRDEEIMGHKPFLVLSDYLTRNGIAVLRFDDRGIAASTGNFQTATSYDFSKDVEAGVKYLQSRKEINSSKIGLIGHSEGGIIAPMLAARSKNIAFIVMLAGGGVRMDSLLVLQVEAISGAFGVNKTEIQINSGISKKIYDIVIRTDDTAQLRKDAETCLRQAIAQHPLFKSGSISEDAFIHSEIMKISSPWFRYFIRYNPAVALEKLKCPVLALNGEKDVQVTPKENLEAIAKALEKGKNKRFTTKELPGLNHLFQECTTGLHTEYAGIEQTFSPVALDIILKWIKEQIMI